MKIYILLILALPFLSCASEINIKKRQALENSENLQNKLLEHELYKACYVGDLDKVKDLIFKGVNVNAECQDSFRPLHVACKNGQMEIVKYLILKEANINIQNINGNTPLHVACYFGQLETVRFLLEDASTRADINILDFKSKSALYWAGASSNWKGVSGNLEIMKYLLSCDLKLLGLPDCNNMYPLGLITDRVKIKELIGFVEKENLKQGMVLQLKLEYFGHWGRSSYVWIRLLQQGIDHEFGNNVFNYFNKIFNLGQNGEKYKTALDKFNFIKSKVEEMIFNFEWCKIQKIYNSINITYKQRDSKGNFSFLPFFFTEYQIFKIAQRLSEISPEEMKNFVEIISKEYDIITVTDEYNLNLLDIAPNKEIYSFIASINPNLIKCASDRPTQDTLEFGGLSKITRYFYNDDYVKEELEELAKK